MSQAVKRISKSSVNWQKLSERLTSQQEAELSRLKNQNTYYSSQINNFKADIPKIDFAALKKQLPAQATMIDSLQKQYEALSIPYGSIPEPLNAEVVKWTKYNEARQKFQSLKTADSAEEAKKVKEKWSKAPPIEQFRREHFPQYFPKLHYDLRVKDRITDPCNIGLNEYESMEYRFKDYKVLSRPDKEESH